MSKEREEYEADVFYEAWRRGYNPDNAVECAYDCFDYGCSPEACVDGYAQRVKARREEREMEAIERAPDNQAGGRNG